MPASPNSHYLPYAFIATLSLLFLSASTKPYSLLPKIPVFNLNHFPRRRLLFMNPSMSSSNLRRPKPFSTPESLSDWLQPRLPSDSFASWGTKPGTKNIHNLWAELSEGESSLVDSTPPIRTVHVVTVRIRNRNGGHLIESEQELSDGTIRERSRPLSEKMKPGESVESAVIRAVKEELGSIIEGDASSVVRVLPGSYEEKVEERVTSVSYPGLPACYVLHSVEASVEGLPSEDFWTEEEGEHGEYSRMEVADKAVRVKKHFWKWIGSSSSS